MNRVLLIMAMLTNDLVNQPYKVDYTVIKKANSIVSNIVGGALGFVAVLIVIALPLITALDILYLTSPMFSELARRYKWDNTEQRVFRVVSLDAVKAYEDASVDIGKMPITTYLKRRLPTYIISMAILTFIMVGNDSIIALSQNIVTSIIKVIW